MHPNIPGTRAHVAKSLARPLSYGERSDGRRENRPESGSCYIRRYGGHVSLSNLPAVLPFNLGGVKYFETEKEPLELPKATSLITHHKARL